MAKQDNPDIAQLQQQIAELLDHIKRSDAVEIRQQLADLHDLVRQVAGMNTAENVLANGFEVLVTQLAPLRDLTPARQHLSRGAYVCLDTLRQALDRPNWSDAGPLSLSTRDQNVTYIGGVPVVARPDERSSLS